MSAATALRRKPDWTHWLALLVFAAPIAAGLLLPAVQQPARYHQFADNRACFGIPNCLDVLSNLPFIAIGSAGLALVLGGGALRVFAQSHERWSYVAFFTGALLVGFGSAYYHWAPDGLRLAWDRLPVTIAFMSLLAATISERVDVRIGVRWLAPLVLVGMATVLYWRWGMQRGAGDLLPYGVVQYGGIAAILVLALARPSRYTRGGDIFILFVWYGLAKGGEIFDQPIYALTGFVSGHTLKHLCAGLAVYWIYRSLRRRRSIQQVGRPD